MCLPRKSAAGEEPCAVPEENGGDVALGPSGMT